MLSTEMLRELEYVYSMVLCGAVLAFTYHLLVFLRTLVHHGNAIRDAQDILFFVMAGVLFFLVVYEKNDGILRWYAFGGCGLGCFFYLKTAGCCLEAVRKWLLKKIGKPIKIGAYQRKKGQVSAYEGCSPERKKKREKKKRA